MKSQTQRAKANSKSDKKRRKSQTVEGELNCKENCGSSGRTAKVLRKRENPKWQQTTKANIKSLRQSVKCKPKSQRIESWSGQKLNE